MKIIWKCAKRVPAIRALTVSYLLLAAAASSAAQAGNWTTHRYPADGFSISLPADPQIQTEPGRPGSSIQLRLYVVDLGQDQLIIGAVQLTAAAASMDPESILQAAKSNGLAKSNTHLVSEKKIALGDAPSLDIEFENETEHSRSRFHKAGSSLYILTVTAPIGKPFDHTAEFLDSFRLIAAAPADARPGNCIILMGGGGTVTPNEDVNKRWFTIDGVVDRALEKDLTDSGYRVDELIVDIRTSSARMAALAQEQTKSGCKQVVQVTHELSSSPGNAGVVNQFGFEVSVGHLEEVSASPHAVRFVSEYDRKYSYPLTTEVMQHLSLNAVAQQMASDLAQANILLK